MKTRKFRKKQCTVILLFVAFSIFVIFISSYHHTHRLRRLKELRLNKSLLKQQQQQQQSALISSSAVQEEFKKPEDEATVLLWTNYFGDDYRVDASWILTNATYPKCFEKCRVVVDKTDLATSDAVVFHSRDMRKSEMPLVHPTDQLWVYLQQESPTYTREDLTEYGNVFNWTMTYRLDSDIYHPYFLTLPLNLSEKSINVNVATTSHLHPKFLQQKTKLVAWIVSNCHTKAKRENYVDQLESYIHIDIFGSCGDYPCRRSGEGCLPEIAHQYKFYLAFENSLCTEYITEKFSNALRYNLVPIVYGGGDYSSVAPPGSYINVHDFATPKALAEYLLLLHRNPKLYLQYFQWKTKYQVVVGDGLCSLCRKVAQHKLQPVKKIYDNLSSWWHYQNISPTGEELSENQGPLPTCLDVSEDLLDNWNVVSFVKGFKYVKRWFYREMLG